MKKLLTVVAAGLMLLGAYGTSQAISLPIDFSYSGVNYEIQFVTNGGVYTLPNTGIYLGTVVKVDKGGPSPNDSVAMLEAVLAALEQSPVITEYAKVDGPFGSASSTGTGTDYTLTVTPDPGNLNLRGRGILRPRPRS